MGVGGSIQTENISMKFLVACVTGHLELVRQLLPIMTFEEINSTDSDGNTGLHLACIQNNFELVRLLLQAEHGDTFCVRTIVNKQGFTAYQCTKSHTVRKLFTRPIPLTFNTRFKNTYQSKSNIQEEDIPHDWNQGYKNAKDAQDAKFILDISRSSWLLRKLYRLRTESEICEAIANLIRKSTDDTKTYQSSMKYLNLFRKTKNLEYLLTLYTKELEICKILQKENNAFTALLYLHLKSLQNRTFNNGDTFRGMSFENKTQYDQLIRDYRWANQDENYILETRVLQSTSKKRSLAEFYIEIFRPIDGQAFEILCHYHFSNPCFTAIDLKNISIYEDEEEVLILPFTLFKVNKIEQISPNKHIITLINVPVPRISL